MKTDVEIVNISASYGDDRVLHDLSLRAEAGELVALLGASGCGKSTALKVISGVIAPEKGTVLIGGEDVTRTPAEKRGAVMMFQKPLLFPYLSVAGNVAFGLRMRGTPKREIRDRVTEALRLVQLTGFEDRMPNELSGGQEQRVALARAFVTEPRVLLLDEPLSALDANLRAEMRSLVSELQKRLGITTIFVTHDQAEAVAVADRIAYMNSGRIEQYSKPGEFFTAPKTACAAAFFGWKVSEGKMIGNKIETPIGHFLLPEGHESIEKNGQSALISVAFHPNNLRFWPQNGTPHYAICCEISKAIDHGTHIEYLVKLPDGSTIQTGYANQRDSAGQRDTAGTANCDPAAGKIMAYIPKNSARFFSTP